jgi:hypothetical protein
VRLNNSGQRIVLIYICRWAVCMSPSARGRSVGLRAIPPVRLNRPLEIAHLTLAIGLASMAINLRRGGGYDFALQV